MSRTRNVLLSTILLAGSAAAGPPATRDDAWMPADLDYLRQDAWRNDLPTAFASATLDMNGDGLMDEAMLVTDPVGHRSGLRICLASKQPKASRECHVLAVVDDALGYDVMGLLVEPAGCYDYFALNDGPEVKAKVCSRAHVLDYFRFGSAASYFVYDRKTRRFNRYWYSD